MRWHEMDVLARALILMYSSVFVLGIIAGLLLSWLVSPGVGIPLAGITSFTALCYIACAYFAEWYLKRDCIGIPSKKE